MSEKTQKIEAEEPETDTDPLRLIEALLFASAEPVHIKVLHERMPEGTDVGGLLMQLKEQYKDRGVTLVEMDGTWAFRTASDLGKAMQMEKEVQRRLSRAALETLAIVAYHQPVTRAEVENIRGVATHKGTLDILMEMGWVKPGRRRETAGRPLTWVTTTAFLDQFGLESMMDLPGLDEMKASGLLDRRPAIDAIPGSDDLFGADEEDRAESDEENHIEDDESEQDDLDEEAFEDESDDDDEEFDDAEEEALEAL